MGGHRRTHLVLVAEFKTVAMVCCMVPMPDTKFKLRPLQVFTALDDVIRNALALGRCKYTVLSGAQHWRMKRHQSSSPDRLQSLCGVTGFYHTENSEVILNFFSLR